MKGDTWMQIGEHGREMLCKCLGNGNSEWKCDFTDMCEFGKDEVKKYYAPGDSWTYVHEGQDLTGHKCQ
jgi:hypothetical protein